MCVCVCVCVCMLGVPGSAAHTHPYLPPTFHCRVSRYASRFRPSAVAMCLTRGLLYSPIRVHSVQKIPISKSLSTLATPVEPPAELDRVCYF